MSRIRPRDAGEASRLAALTEIDARFPRLPHPIRDFLAAHPRVFCLLIKLQRSVDLGLLSAEDLVNLARRWTDSLPDRRGRVLELHVQPDLPLLPLHLPRRPSNRAKRRQRKRPLGS